jgi:hypothetical protein
MTYRLNFLTFWVVQMSVALALFYGDLSGLIGSWNTVTMLVFVSTAVMKPQNGQLLVVSPFLENFGHFLLLTIYLVLSCGYYLLSSTVFSVDFGTTHGKLSYFNVIFAFKFWVFIIVMVLIVLRPGEFLSATIVFASGAGGFLFCYGVAGYLLLYKDWEGFLAVLPSPVWTFVILIALVAVVFLGPWLSIGSRRKEISPSGLSLPIKIPLADLSGVYLPLFTPKSKMSYFTDNLFRKEVAAIGRSRTFKIEGIPKFDNASAQSTPVHSPIQEKTKTNTKTKRTKTSTSSAEKHPLKDAQKKFVESVVKDKVDDTQYEYFGNGNNTEILIEFLLKNPFFTSAMSYNTKTDKYCVTSAVYDKHRDVESKYTRIMQHTYDASFPRVNIQFSELGDRELTYQVYRYGTLQKDYSKQKATSLLLFSLMYYAEAIHATMHIADLILGMGIVHATDIPKCANLQPWAQSFLVNLPLKELEVELLLLKDEVFPFSRIPGLSFLLGAGALVGGGWEGHRKKLLKFIKKEFLKVWFRSPTVDDFIEKFLFDGIDKSKRGVLLKEHLKHLKLIPKFAQDLINAMTDHTNCRRLKRGANEKNAHAAPDHDDASCKVLLAKIDTYSIMNQRLKEYMDEVGDDVSYISNFKEWIHIKHILGIMHGSTMSFSRILATPDVLMIMSEESVPHKMSDTYTSEDQNHFSVILSTMDGIDKERHVFTSSFVKNGEVTDNDLKTVLTKYDKDRKNLQKTYWSEIKDDKRFAEFGWIWTDYAPDNIDNKQLTLTTYI